MCEWGQTYQENSEGAEERKVPQSCQGAKGAHRINLGNESAGCGDVLPEVAAK